MDHKTIKNWNGDSDYYDYKSKVGKLNHDGKKIMSKTEEIKILRVKLERG